MVARDARDGGNSIVVDQHPKYVKDEAGVRSESDPQVNSSRSVAGKPVEPKPEPKKKSKSKGD